MTYSPPGGGSIAFSLPSGYVPPNIESVNFIWQVGPAKASPKYVSVCSEFSKAGQSDVTGVATVWSRAASKATASDPGWAAASSVLRIGALSWRYPRQSDSSGGGGLWDRAVAKGWKVTASYAAVFRRDHKLDVVGWELAPITAGVAGYLQWMRVLKNDTSRKLCGWRIAFLPRWLVKYGDASYSPPIGDTVTFSLVNAYQPPTGDVVYMTLSNGYQSFEIARADPAPASFRWGLTRLVDGIEGIPWGAGPPYRHDPPPTGSDWTGSPDEPPPMPIVRRVYIIMNDVQVVRLPDGTPIDVLSVDLAATVDAWCWSVRMELANPAQVALLKPDGNGPKLVQITMNGYVWTAIIETRDYSRGHADMAPTVSGRSQTALLSDAYTARRSKAVQDPFTAQQLALQEISDRALPFLLDWRGVDWLVPGGVWYYRDMAPIDVIAQIAAARGAVVQSAPGDAQLVVQSRYPVSPWAWSAGAADVALPIDWVTAVEARQQSKPMYDAVIIAGQQQGVLARVTRQGSAGTTFASQVVDQLILTPEVATERGRNILADRGVQEQVDMELPLFPAGTVTAGMSGLYAPLLLVDVQDPDDPWQGQSVGVTISARRGGPDSKALEIWQRVSLERHISDAH